MVRLHGSLGALSGPELADLKQNCCTSFAKAAHLPLDAVSARSGGRRGPGATEGGEVHAEGVPTQRLWFVFRSRCVSWTCRRAASSCIWLCGLKTWPRSAIRKTQAQTVPEQVLARCRGDVLFAQRAGVASAQQMIPTHSGTIWILSALVRVRRRAVTQVERLGATCHSHLRKWSG